jgi:UDP-3-O-[3-hydroxymyristoyl] glucosamine N-acyltransferase
MIQMITKTSPITNLETNSFTYVKSKKFLELFIKNYVINQIGNISVFIKSDLLTANIKRPNFLSKNITWIPTENPEFTFLEKHNEIYKFEKPGRNSEFYIIMNQLNLHNFINKNAFLDDTVNYIFGKDNFIGAGAVLGAQGFKVFKRNGKLERLTHVGGIKLGNECEIKASYIDRSIFENTYTELENNVFLDNGVHIAHNVLIKSNTLIVANSVIGGSVKIGYNCWIGEGVLIRDNIEIGNNVFLAMGSVVTKDVGDNEQLAGNFAVNKNKMIAHTKWIDSHYE